MTTTSTLARTCGALALGTLLLAACQTTPPAQQAATPMTLTPGTVQYDLRQQQIRNMQSGVNPGVQNPVATGVGVGGIERVGTGAGSTAAGAPVAVNPGTSGIERGEGVGAPAPGSSRVVRSRSRSRVVTPRP